MPRTDPSLADRLREIRWDGPLEQLWPELCAVVEAVDRIHSPTVEGCEVCGLRDALVRRMDEEGL